MPHTGLTRPIADANQPTSFADRIQLALAIADESVLQSLLTDCSPRISPPNAIGTVSATVGIPIASAPPAYGVITFEKIRCVLSRSPDELEQHLYPMGDSDRLHRHFERLTRYESETQTLGHGLSLAESLALLANVGFTPAQTERILTLPYGACHKSWWYTLDADGQIAMPFHRTLWTRPLCDGTFILQYKDRFAQDRPPCFHSQPVSVLVEVLPATERFGEAIAQINRERHALQPDYTILISDRLPSSLEAQAYTRQGMSLILAHDLSLQSEANCQICATGDCPMNGQHSSPVRTCRRFSATIFL